MQRMTLVSGALLLGACTKPADLTSAEQSLRQANAAYDRALINGDAAALNRFYTDDFQIISADAEVHGKADQIEFMTKQVDLLNAKTDDVRVTMLAPDKALLTGRLKGRYRFEGKENDFVERYTSIWVREGDGWRLKHEHSSMAPPEGERRS